MKLERPEEGIQLAIDIDPDMYEAIDKEGDLVMDKGKPVRERKHEL